MQLFFLEIEGIAITIVRKSVKNINLSICPDTIKVRVSVPLQMQEAAIKTILQKKIRWIKSKLAYFQTNGSFKDKAYITGEQHFFLGQSYGLNVIVGSQRPCVQLRQDLIELSVAANANLEKRKALLNAWYRFELKKRIAPIIEKWEHQTGLKVSAFGVKAMKTRWGSCNINARRIWLNLTLALKPIECLEYVILHEMVHLLERTHNHRFKAYMDKFMPNWREYELILNPRKR